MRRVTRSALVLALGLSVLGGAGSLAAQERGPHPGKGQAPAGPPPVYVEPLGVPVSPAIYLANFILLYVSNPDVAAAMPAYSAALPQEVYSCLVENPKGCPYADMAHYFAAQAAQTGGSRNKHTFWPLTCQTDARWQALAPPPYRTAEQINAPLGRAKADRLAALLGITPDMILTPDQYACQIGTFPRDPAREIISVCTADLTNSSGTATIPLSSYGLSLNTHGDVRSNCAPEAPCLVFNKLIYGPLEKIAHECGFWDKFLTWGDPTRTPLVHLVDDGVACQEDWLDACIVEAACPGNGPQSNNTCAPSIAPH